MQIPKSSTDLFRLDGRVALVTGGSKGLGEAIAIALSGAGAAYRTIGKQWWVIM